MDLLARILQLEEDDKLQGVRSCTLTAEKKVSYCRRLSKYALYLSLTSYGRDAVGSDEGYCARHQTYCIAKEPDRESECWYFHVPGRVCRKMCTRSTRALTLRVGSL